MLKPYLWALTLAIGLAVLPVNAQNIGPGGNVIPPSGGGGGSLPSGGTAGQLLGTSGGTAGVWQSFAQPDTGAQNRTWASKAQDQVSVWDFIPAGTNTATTDVSSYFQAAATAGCARSPTGVQINVPAGTYLAHDINNTCGNLWVGAGSGGIGSSNQTTTSSIVPGNTTIKYTSATNYFMQWQVSGFPSFASKNHINGGGITSMQLIDGSSTATTLISEGTQDWRATYLTINGAYNGVYMKGDEFPVTSHISMYGTRNQNYTMVGDLSGETVSGTACSTSNGDCSTRNDAWFGDYLTNIDNLQTNTVFTITGFVATPTLSHTSGEGPAYGMVISCPSGLNTALSQCPTFGRFDDIQIENYKYYGVQITDSSQFIFMRPYLVGDGTASNVNNIYASSSNYSNTNIGGLIFENGTLFATGHDSVYLGGTMYDLEFVNNDIYAGNLANNNYNAINAAGTLQDLKVIHNTIGQVRGYGGVYPYARAVNISANIFNAEITDNFFNPSGGVGYATWNGSSYTQVSPIANASNTPSIVHISGNAGPGGAPTISSCGSGSGVTSGYQDSDFVMQTGSGVGTSCVATFGTIQPASPVCQITGYPGSQLNPQVTPSTTGVTVSAASTLAGAYEVHCSTIGK